MPSSICEIHDCNLQYDTTIVMLFCPECRTNECEDCYGTGKKHTQDNSMLDDPCKVCGGSGQKKTE